MKTEKETAMDVKKKGIVLSLLSWTMFRMLVNDGISGQSKQIQYRYLNLSMYRMPKQKMLSTRLNR